MSDVDRLLSELLDSDDDTEVCEIAALGRLLLGIGKTDCTNIFAAHAGLNPLVRSCTTNL